MNAPRVDGLHHLVVFCHEASQRYQDAARTVGDPGLRLQFKRLAEARGVTGATLSVVGGVSVTHLTVSAPVRVSSPAEEKVRLGGEAEPRPLNKSELHALVRSLRAYDEDMLAEFRRLRPHAVSEVAATLDLAVEGLMADLDKMRILEDLAHAPPPR